MISVAPQENVGMKPVIELEDEHGYAFASSEEYPLNEDSLPQIKDARCGIGKHYIHVYYPDSIYRKVKLNVNGVVDYTGIDWECPFEAGNYSDSLYYENSYYSPTFAFPNSYDPIVYHRFAIKDEMDISIISEDYLNSIVLYDSTHRMLRKVKREDPFTILDAFNLSPGTYFLQRKEGSILYI